MIAQALLHYYRAARAHQMATYENGSGGGAFPGFHAAAAYDSARSTIYFRAELSKTVAAHKHRSRSAKRGWKTRRAAS